MKTNFPKFVVLAAGLSTVLLSGCATGPSTNDKNAAEVASNNYITGSRLAIKNTTEMIGIKTIEKADIRDNKMFNTIVVDGK